MFGRNAHRIWLVAVILTAIATLLVGCGDFDSNGNWIRSGGEAGGPGPVPVPQSHSLFLCPV